MPRAPAQRSSAASNANGAVLAQNVLKRNQVCISMYQSQSASLLRNLLKCQTRLVISVVRESCDAQMPCSACIKTHAHALKSHPDSTGPVPDCSFDDPHEVAEGPKAKIQKLEDKIARLEALLNNKDSTDSEKILRSPSTLAEPSPPSEAEGRPGSAKSTSSPLFSPHPPTMSAPTVFTSPSNLGSSHAPPCQ
ncbi:hypothetical protein FRC02_005851 [Tulasnella sp. 418]|nr:hypothetical protein FRC02_005851 [Tulasnella sp. 418]